MSKISIIAACGLDCAECDIYRAKSEPDVMKGILDWLNRDVPDRCKPEDVHCDGCLGDRSVHWSADCDILTCCVDAKEFKSCSECGELPCERLKKWSENGPRYTAALESLMSARQKAAGGL